jgi:hypothetical protein
MPHGLLYISQASFIKAASWIIIILRLKRQTLAYYF